MLLTLSVYAIFTDLTPFGPRKVGAPRRSMSVLLNHFPKPLERAKRAQGPYGLL